MTKDLSTSVGMKLVGKLIEKLQAEDPTLSPERQAKLIELIDTLEVIKGDNQELNITLKRDGIETIVEFGDIEFAIINDNNKEEFIHAIRLADSVCFETYLEYGTKMQFSFESKVLEEL